MSTPPPVLIVRAAGGDEADFLKHAEAAGVRPLLCAAARIEAVVSNEALSDIPDVLIFTSANAARHFNIPPQVLSQTAFCNGEQTEDILRSKGFRDVCCIKGTAESLGRQIIGILQTYTKVLYVRGEDVNYDLSGLFREAGLIVAERIVYRAVLEPRLSGDVISALRANTVQAISFFSKRTALHFIDLCRQEGFADKLSKLAVLPISEAVLECVRPVCGGQAYIAKTPDRQGMLNAFGEFVSRQKYKGFAMQNNAEEMHVDAAEGALDKAETIIERFGGIRPMASKMAIPVTTVQGWKKRGVIPGNRRAEIVLAAAQHQIDLSDVLSALQSGATANENAKIGHDGVNPATYAPQVTQSFDTPFSTASAAASGGDFAGSFLLTKEDLARHLKTTERKAVTKSTLITLTLGGAIAAAAVVLLLPQMTMPPLGNVPQDAQQKIAALEEKIAAMEGQQSGISGMIPENLSQTIADLQEKTKGLQEGMGAALTRAEAVGADVLGADAGTLEQRIAKLEAHAANIAEDMQVSTLLERWGVMEATADGQSQLKVIMAQLGSAIAAAPPPTAENPDTVTAALETARQQDAALGQAFAGVPASDLKAAAYLLAMTQMRSSLAREKQPFAEDLKILMSFVGGEDAALKASLEKLAPQAEKGVLTPSGLSTELRSMTGDIVAASLSGEDVSIQERAQAKFGELLQIEKNGEPLSGTPTQATIAKSQSLLESGDLAGAIASMKTLEGPALGKASGWIGQAEATLLAQDIGRTIGRNLKASVAQGGITANGSLKGRTTLLQDPASGTTVLKLPKTRQFENLGPAGPAP